MMRLARRATDASWQPWRFVNDLRGIPVKYATTFVTFPVTIQPSARAATFALALTISVERAWGRLLRPDMWAEDGLVFLLQALTNGFASLKQPMAGSYFTLERLIVLCALHLVPLAWVPAAVCCTCVVILAAVMSTIAGSRYEWLIPSQGVRVLAACMFCLLPGLNEMMGNLCNLNWILFCWLALVGLKDPALSITTGELILSALLVVSMGTAILLVPLFGWRLLTALRLQRPRRVWMPDLIQLSIVLVLGVGLLLFVNRPRGSSVDSYLLVGRVWYDHVARLVAVTPWIGDRMTYVISRVYAVNAYRVSKVLFLLFAVVWGWRHRREGRVQVVLLFVAGVSFWTVLAIMARPTALEFLLQYMDATLYTSRYSFIMSFAGIIFWLVVLSHPAAGPGRPGRLMIAFVALNLILPLHRFTIEPYGPERRWQVTVEALQQSITTGCPHAVDIREYPDPWSFRYVAPNPASGCKP